MAFWTYMLRCADGRYYTGHTDHLERRIGEHRTGVCGFTSTRLPVNLVWSQDFPSRIEALEAERTVGGWSRAKKEALIRGDWKAVSFFARPPKERFSASARSIEACPERLPQQAVEGLDTNEGWKREAQTTPFVLSEVEKPGSGDRS